MVSPFHYEVIQKNADQLNSAIVYDRDFNYQFFGFKTLERSYLLKIDGKVSLTWFYEVTNASATLSICL